MAILKLIDKNNYIAICEIFKTWKVFLDIPRNIRLETFDYSKGPNRRPYPLINFLIFFAPTRSLFQPPRLLNFRFFSSQKKKIWKKSVQLSKWQNHILHRNIISLNSDAHVETRLFNRQSFCWIIQAWLIYISDIIKWWYFAWLELWFGAHFSR